MSDGLPPQRKVRIPDYSPEDREELQRKMDYLRDEGVLCRAEDINQPVEYAHASYLLNKKNGGKRMVTSFGQMADYARPQPTMNSNSEHTIQQIGDFEELIIIRK